MDLTEDDVLEILKLFEQSKFDFLQLEQGERKITVSKGGYVPAGTPAAAAVSRPAAQSAPPPAASPAPSPAAKAPAVAVAEGLVAITAPMVGKFYSAPAPSDPAYVEVGSKVAAGAAVG